MTDDASFTPSDQPVPPTAAAAAEDEPQFGLLDVVEAFTAMRHEWRGQRVETRQLGDALQNAVAQLGELETRLMAAASAATAPASDTSERLVAALVEIDVSLTRAVDAAADATPRRGDAAALHQAVRQAYDSSGPLCRWFARAFDRSVHAAIDRCAAATEEDPIVAGIRLLSTRVRRLLAEQRIERIETVGQPFDGQTMNAVDAVDQPGVPSGQVVAQLRPAYRWQGRLIQYADVRVAR